MSRWLLRNPYTTTGSWPSRRIRYVNDSDWRSFIARTLDAADQLDSSVFDRDAIQTSGRELLAGNPERVDDVERAVLFVELSRMLNCGVSEYLLEAPLTNLQPDCSAVTQPA